MRWGPSISLWGWGKKVLLTFPQFKYSNAPKKAHFSFTLDESVECHQNFCFFLMWPNFFLIRCAKIFSSIFRGARKTLKNCANYTNFTNLVMVCEEWGEEKNVVRMRSSLPWPMRFEVTFLNVFVQLCWTLYVRSSQHMANTPILGPIAIFSRTKCLWPNTYWDQLRYFRAQIVCPYYLWPNTN